MTAKEVPVGCAGIEVVGSGPCVGRHEAELLAIQDKVLEQELLLRKQVAGATEEVVALFEAVYPEIERRAPMFAGYAEQVRAVREQLAEMRRREQGAEVHPDVRAVAAEGPHAAELLRNLRKVSATAAYFSAPEIFQVLATSVHRLLTKVAAREPALAAVIAPQLSALVRSWDRMLPACRALAVRRVLLSNRAPDQRDRDAAFAVWLELLQRNPKNSYLHALAPHEGRTGPRRIIYFSIGGLGDALLQTPCVAAIKRRFAPCEIVFVHGRPFVPALFEGNRTVATAVYAQDGLLMRLINASKLLGIFDIVFESRFLVWADNCHGSRNPPEDLAWIERTQSLVPAFKPYLERFPLYSNLFARIIRPRMLLDIHGLSTGLPVGVDSPLLMFPAAADANFCERVGLVVNGYVTVHDGFDETFGGQMGITRCTKQLPSQAWRTLIGQIKRQHLQVVQVGAAKEPVLPGIDLDLRGKTSLSQLGHVLKRALVHVDTEGGIVHVARAMHKRSIVFFGPTSVTFWGHPRNVNLCSEEYADFWWINPDWMARSPLQQKMTPMEAFNDMTGVARLIAAEKAAATRRGYTLDATVAFAGDDTDPRAGEFVRTQVVRRFGIRPALAVAIVGHSARGGMPVGPVETFDIAETCGDLTGALEGATSVLGSPYNLPANSEAYDAVVCSGALDAVARQRPAFCELLRLLKPGGVLLLGFRMPVAAPPAAEEGERAEAGLPALIKEACGVEPVFTAPRRQGVAIPACILGSDTPLEEAPFAMVAVARIR